MPSMTEESRGGSRFNTGTEMAGTKNSTVFLLELASTYQHDSIEDSPLKVSSVWGM